MADSDGHLSPWEVESYIGAGREVADRIRIGFHAHDNLGLAQVNALVAVQSGGDSG